MDAIENHLREALRHLGKAQDLHPAAEVALALTDVRLTLDNALFEHQHPTVEATALPRAQLHTLIPQHP